MGRLAAVSLAALLLVGCASLDDDEATSPPASATTAPPAPAPPPADGGDGGQGQGGAGGAGAGAPAGPERWAQLPLALRAVAEVPAPIALTARPDVDELLVASREGQVRRLTRGADPGSWQVEPEPVVDLSAEVTTGGERGLLGIATSADGATLYLSYTDLSGTSVLEAVALGPATVDLATRRVLLRVPQPFANHNGGHVVLGPDGMLWWGLGDGGGAGDPEGNGQDPTTLLGAVLRIDPTPSGDRPYAIPADNPFADGGPGAPEVWLWGVRNPWRFSFDRATGDLWLGDVGQDRWEEVDRLAADDHQRGRGANLGWAAMEGLEPFEGGSEPPGHHPPLLVYAREGGRCAVTGGQVYRGPALPELEGVYVYGDVCEGQLLGAAVLADGTVAEAPLAVAPVAGQLVSFGEGRDGELYVLELQAGRVSQLVPGG